MARFRVADAAVAMAGQVKRGVPEMAFDGITLDSRRAAGGRLFFALAGERTDGHGFGSDAAGRGAAGAVVARAVELEPGVAPEFAVVEVDDVYRALHRLTAWARDRLPAKLIAVTGSAGKTTTKEILVRLLGQRFRAAASPGNFNNLLGFPVALLGIPNATEWMVAEMGMSLPGELAEVSRLGRPDAALFTNVRAVHLEAFDAADATATLRDIGEAKAELLAGLGRGAVVVANAADAEVARIARRHARSGGRVVWYALGEAPEPTRLRLRAVEAVPAADGAGLSYECEVEDSATAAHVSLRLPLYGRVNLENFLAAATAAVELGVEVSGFAAALDGLENPAGRGRVLTVGGARVIDDSYNSNPAALEAALSSATELDGRRRWAVLGSMLELGRTSKKLHEHVGRVAGRLGFSPVVGVGSEARALVAAARQAGVRAVWLEDAAAAAELVRRELRPGDVVLIKGSRGIGLERIVDGLSELAEGDG